VAAAEVDPGYRAPRAEHAPRIDGDDSDTAWQVAPWRSLTHTLVGSPPTRGADFSGRYKLVWTRDSLFLLAEIHDDILIDGHADPLQGYWADDALEVLIDEDASGGNHQFNDSAFAYHIALDNQVVDIRGNADGSDGKAALYNDHLQSVWKRSAQAPYPLIWELRVDIHPDPAKGGLDRPRRLRAGEVLGFALAWCDSDTPGERTRMVADVDVAAVDGDRNRLYTDAGSFGRLELLP
jgi:hypothetical protein